MSSRRYRYDPDHLWLLVEQVSALPDSPNPPGLEVRLHTFEDLEPARDFLRAGPPGTYSPAQPLLRTPLERAAPLLAAAAAAVLREAGAPPAQLFLELALRLARLDLRLSDLYRDTRRALLYEAPTSASDPRRPLEEALRPYLEQFGAGILADRPSPLTPREDTPCPT